MKKIIALLTLRLVIDINALAQTTSVAPQNVATDVKSKKYLSSSILLWMRTDKPRQAGMDRWKGPHSKIISANKGLEEYRQIHVLETNPGLWPAINGVETRIPIDRKLDGIADVTLKNVFSLFRGKKQNKLAYADEVNLFKRTILYVALGKNSRWYALNPDNQPIQARSIVFFRIKEGVAEKDFNAFINQELTPRLANTGVLNELRTKVYMPWKQKQWDTPNVAHDNPKEAQFQASIMLGFADKKAMDDFFNGRAVKQLADKLAVYTSAVHAYEIAQTLTYVKEGKRLDQYQN